MPTALIVCAGSRGDIEPFVALSVALANNDQHWNVCLCVQSDYVELVPKHDRIDTFTLPFALVDMEHVFYEMEAAATTKPQVDFGEDKSLFAWSCIGAMSAKLVNPLTRNVLQTAESIQVDIVVYTLLTRPLALAVADKLQVKSCYVHLQPQVPTSVFPHHRSQDVAAKGIIQAVEDPESEIPPEVANQNMESYWSVERLLYKVCGDSMNAAREEVGLAALSLDAMTASATGDLDRMFIANAFPSVLVPHCADYGKNVHSVGPLADTYLPQDWTPDPKLYEFLAAGPPPVCVGFGSMRLSNNGARVTQLVYAALRAANIERVVVVGGIAELGNHQLTEESEGGTKQLLEWANTHVFQVEGAVPYSWLLPRCSAIICHGGAGVVSASIRAGATPVVAPRSWDQFMWARVLDSRGLGVFAGPSALEVTQETLVVSVKKAVSDEMRNRLRGIASRIRNEPSGTEALVKLLCDAVL